MFIEMSYPEFERKFPRIAKDFGNMISDEALEQFRSDPDYIVRINHNGVEIGYKSDDWHMEN